MRKAISAGPALVVTALVLGACTGAVAAPLDARVQARSSGGDRATAERIARTLLAGPLDLQLTHVRCERYGMQHFCGLVLSGVKFHRRLDTARFQSDVDALVRGALAVDPAIAEVDLWVTVPADAGKGATVSGDFALPTSATVYATTVPRAQAAHPSTGPGVFWDATFKRELAAGSAG